MTDVFISYSRKDTDFVRQLFDALKAQGRDAWVDWQGIDYSTKWWEEICAGIDRADNFVLVISPDALNSRYCHDEITHARQHGKRIIPFIYQDLDEQRWERQPLTDQARDNWNYLKTIQFISYPKLADFDKAVTVLLDTVATDPIHVRMHTDLLAAALAWQNTGRSPGFLLRDERLVEAENWLSLADTEQKDPQSTADHRAFITASRQAANKQKARVRQIRVGIVALVTVAIIAFIGAGVAVLQANNSNNQAATATVAQGQAIVAQETSTAQVATVASLLTAVPPTLDAIGTRVQESNNRVESQRLAVAANDLLSQPSKNAELAALLSIRGLKIGYTVPAFSSLVQATNQLYSQALLVGHTSAVNGVLELRDGRLLSWAWDNTLRLWNGDGQTLAILIGHTENIEGALELQNGNLLTWSGDSTLRLWDKDGRLLTIMLHDEDIRGAIELRNGQLLTWSYQSLAHLWTNEGRSIRAITFEGGNPDNIIELRDGNLLGWSFWDNLGLWTSEGRLIRILTATTTDIDDVSGVLELHDGRILSWSHDYSLRLYTSNGHLLKVLAAHTDIVKGALELHDGHLLSWSDDLTLRLWDSEGTLIKTLNGHTGLINGATELQGRRLLSWSDNGMLRLWDSDGNLLKSLSGYTYGVAGAIELSSGRILSWGVAKNDNCDPECSIVDNWLKLWDGDGEIIATLTGNQKPILGAKQLQDGRILSWSYDADIRIWQEEIPNVVHLSKNSLQNVLQLADKKLLIQVKNDKDSDSLQIWDKEGLTSFSEHPNHIIGKLQLRDGRILTLSESQIFQLWDNQGQLLSTLNLPKKINVQNIIELHNGDLFSWESNNKKLYLWNTTGALLYTITESMPNISKVLELQDGRLLWWGSDYDLRLWSVGSDTFTTLKGHGGRVYGALELRDGRLLSWASDETIRLWTSKGKPLTRLNTPAIGVLELRDGRLLSWALPWDPETIHLWTSEGEPLGILNSPADGVLELQDNHLLTWSDKDAKLRLWDSNGRLLTILNGFTEGIAGVLELRDGRLLAWGDCRSRTTVCDPTLRLWSGQGELLATLAGHTDIILGVMELDDQRLISWSDDDTMRLWYVNSTDFINYACTRVVRDFTPEERQTYGITDTTPTCPQFGS